MILVLIAMSVILAVIAGVSKAIMDTLAHHYDRSVFKGLNAQFWNIQISHLNKYRDRNVLKGPRFFLSTTVLVWTTDAWHLFQMIFLISITISFSILGPIFSHDLTSLVIGFTVLQILYRLIFEKVYEKLVV